MKRQPLTILAGIGIGSALLLAYKPNRKRIKLVGSKIKEKLPVLTEEEQTFPVNEAANPHPHNLEDNTMVSEGAMYSVDYFNKTRNG